MVADELDYVIGIDTHLDEHVLAILAAPSGAVVAQRSISAVRQGRSGACAAKTTPSTPPGQHERRLRARRSRFHAAGNGARRCGYCWSRVAAPSTCAAKHSGNSAA